MNKQLWNGWRARNLLNELLWRVDLLGKIVQCLHEIGNISLDYQDKIEWKDMENVYSEVEKEFLCLYNELLLWIHSICIDLRACVHVRLLSFPWFACAEKPNQSGNKQSGPLEYRPKVGCTGIEKEVLRCLFRLVKF